MVTLVRCKLDFQKKSMYIYQTQFYKSVLGFLWSTLFLQLINGFVVSLFNLLNSSQEDTCNFSFGRVRRLVENQPKYINQGGPLPRTEIHQPVRNFYMYLCTIAQKGTPKSHHLLWFIAINVLTIGGVSKDVAIVTYFLFEVITNQRGVNCYLSPKVARIRLGGVTCECFPVYDAEVW